MARFAFLVLALPDDAPSDVNELANRLEAFYDPAPRADGAEMVGVSITTYASVAELAADEAEGCALNGYWTAWDNEGIAGPALAMVA